MIGFIIGIIAGIIIVAIISHIVSIPPLQIKIINGMFDKVIVDSSYESFANRNAFATSLDTANYAVRIGGDFLDTFCMGLARSYYRSTCDYTYDKENRILTITLK
jgi:hypothetical protein